MLKVKSIMIVHKFVSSYLLSNSYILEFENCNNVVIIDCGLFENDALIRWLIKNNKEPSHVFLTHAHGDHFAGINTLKTKYDFKLLATRECATAIKSTKLNFTKYIEIFNGGIIIDMDVSILEDKDKLDLYENTFHCITTPGHSKGGMCIKVNDLLFSGDTIIKDVKVRINKRMGGCHIDFEDSMSKIRNLCEPNCIIYPGHGELINNFF